MTAGQLGQTRALLLAALLCAPSAGAQDRPDEESLFGGEPAVTDGGTPEHPADEPSFDGQAPAEEVRPNALPAQPPGVETSGAEKTRDEQALSGPAAQNAFDSEAWTDDPLRVGGQFYLRAFAQGAEGVSFGATPLSAPTLVDGYFDARPTERLRGMVVARLLFDPTSSTLANNSLAVSGAAPAANPRVLLDQAWLRLDVARTVFVTAGKQHVKWGTGRFWNPTDLLTPQRRDPLAIFDVRTGASMLKLHLPLEDEGWNLYAIGMLDNAGPASTLGQVGGALRAEVLLGPLELGVGSILQRTLRPVFTLDVSSPIGPVDIYGELALRRGSENAIYRLPSGTTVNDAIADPGIVQPSFPTGLLPQVTGGMTFTFAYTDRDTATVGIEYFYNSLGYSQPIAYPYLLFLDATQPAPRARFQPFYAARHYAAVYGLLTGPGSWDKTSFVLSNLANLSDRSFVSRLDVIQQVLSYLSVETYASANYGTRGGEFRFAVDLPALVVPGRTEPISLRRPAPTVQVGIGLRISL